MSTERKSRSFYPRDERKLLHREVEYTTAAGEVKVFAIALLGTHIDAQHEESLAPNAEEYRRLLDVIYEEVGNWILDPENQLSSEMMIENPSSVERYLVIDLSAHPEIFDIVTQFNELFIRDSRGGFEISKKIESPVPEGLIELHPMRYVQPEGRVSTSYMSVGSFQILGVAPSIAGQPGEPKLHVRLLQMPKALEASAAVHRAGRRRTFAT